MHGMSMASFCLQFTLVFRKIIFGFPHSQFQLWIPPPWRYGLDISLMTLLHLKYNLVTAVVVIWCWYLASCPFSSLFVHDVRKCDVGSAHFGCGACRRFANENFVTCWAVTFPVNSMSVHLFFYQFHTCLIWPQEHWFIHWGLTAITAKCSWLYHVVTILELVWARVTCHCYYVFFLRFFFVVVISFSLHAVLPLLANKDEYNEAVSFIHGSLGISPLDWVS